MYRGLDSFRFLAFLGVFLYHVGALPAGYLGVLAFFVLSGFLLTPILVEMRERLQPARYFRSFWGRRSLRIFPLYYFYLVVVAGFAILLSATGYESAEMARFLGQAIYAFTYTYDFYHASRSWTFSPLLTHFWSLAVEEQFYLLWPFVVFWAAGGRLKIILVTMICAGPVLRFVATEAAGMGALSGLVHDRIDLVVYVLPFSHIDAFALGGFMALYARTPSLALTGVVAAALVGVGIFTERPGAEAARLTLGYAPFMVDAGKYVWGYTGWNILFGLMLLMIRDRTLLPGLFEHPWLVRLGKVSYGLYIYHFAIVWVTAALPLARYVGAPWSRLLSASAALTVTIAVSMLSYRYIEQPFLRQKDKWFSRGGRPTPGEIGRAEEVVGVG